MSDEITPALTPEEWARLGAARADNGDTWSDAVSRGAGLLSDVFGPPYDYSRHRLAALALHGQPFGFTRDDLAALRSAALYYPAQATDHDVVCRELDSLATRIAALLSPQ